MLICFNASPSGKEALDSLIATGNFKDVSEAISMALVNYQAISAAFAKGEDPASNFSGPASADSGSNFQPGPDPAKDGIPELFKGGDFTNPESPDAVAPDSSTHNINPRDWLFGQFNKFLPLKASCRCLANLQARHSDGVHFEDAQNEISEACSRLGDQLLRWDSLNRKKRHNALASAFPESSLKGSPGRLRFTSQFVGNIRQGKLHGFPSAMRLVHCTFGREPKLRLTKQGQAFAQIENPVLDSKNTLFSGTRLSEAEICFLRSHIRNYVPEEMAAYDTIIEALSRKADTPDQIDSFLRERFQLASDAEISATFLSTQRTGAISRMADLQLIGREKKGQHVTYFVTPSGIDFQSSLNETNVNQ
jgi:hypothetical protein